MQFRDIYPRTGGGEDIDFIFQLKQKYGGTNCIAAVPGAKARYPWWNSGKICYSQICGWAWGDSLCLSEWPEKTYRCMPNWIEFLLLLLIWAVLTGYRGVSVPCVLSIVVGNHAFKAIKLFSEEGRGWFRSAIVAIGASTIHSAQECTRLIAAMRRGSFLSIGRRMDWFDGQTKKQIFDYQMRSFYFVLVYLAICCCF